MNKELEESEFKLVNMSLWNRVKSNFGDIKQGFKVRELYMTLLFFLIMGSVIPSYTDYFYYYQMDVANFSKFTYAMLGVWSNVCLFIGAIMYSLCLKRVPFRCMMAFACLVNFLSAIGCFLFVKDITFGLSELEFLVITSTLGDTLYNACVQLPSMVVFAKIISPNIETSMFAMLMGLLNLANFFLAKQLGNLINLLVGVTEDNLQDLYKLYLS